MFFYDTLLLAMRILIAILVFLSLAAMKRPLALRHKHGERPHVTKVKDLAWSLRTIPLTHDEILTEIEKQDQPSPYDLAFSKRLAARQYFLDHHRYAIEMSDLEQIWHETTQHNSNKRFSFWSFFTGYKKYVMDSSIQND